MMVLVKGKWRDHPVIITAAYKHKAHAEPQPFSIHVCPGNTSGNPGQKYLE